MHLLGHLIVAALLWTACTIAAWSTPTLTPVVIRATPSGLPLKGWISEPDDRSKAGPAAVFLHGCSGIGSSGTIFPTYRAWTEILNQTGFTVLLIDSAGSRGLGRTCGPVPEREIMYRERPADAYAGLRYLQALEGVDPARIFLFGWSQGGGVLLRTMNTRSSARPSPPPVHDFRAAVAFYPALCSYRMQHRPHTEVEPGTWRTVAPVLILQGARDNWTLSLPCQYFVEELQRRGEPVAMNLYPDAVHSFDAPNMPVHERDDAKTGFGTAPLVGTNQSAREAAIKDVLRFLQDHR